MLKIAVTPEAAGFPTEAAAVRALLESGWDRVHLRHPGASLSEIQRIIESVPQEFHGRIVLHGHFDLCNYFNLGGLHLNRRCPVPPALYRGALSRSVHTIEELTADGSDCFVYQTLSPIFDSISKSGYRAAFTPDDLNRLPAAGTPVIALGGVTVERIPQLRRYNFSGFAMLGAIPWTGSKADIVRFTESINQRVLSDTL